MDVLFSLVLVAHLIAAMSIIGLVLIQHGKGADMGAAFGSGSAGSLFGSSGSANFLSRTTAILAAVFFVTSLALAYMASNKPKATGSVMQDAVKSAPASAPAPGASAEALKAPVTAAEKAKAEAASKTKDIPK